METDEALHYEIRVAGHLSERWSGWFAGLALRQDPNGEPVLCGVLPDQAALFGVLARIQALNLTLVRMYRLPAK